jgi:serine/threonine protein kinase
LAPNLRSFVDELHSVSDGFDEEEEASAKSILVAAIVLGMIAFHESRLIHRDLKSTKLLLDDEHRRRISDFRSNLD